VSGTVLLENAGGADLGEAASFGPLPAKLSAGDPLAGTFSFDLEAGRRNLDAFFEHLGAVVRGWPGGQALLRFGPWLLAATVLAAAALRQQRKRAGDALGPEQDWGPTTAAMRPGDEL
jgi:hypothetical protein